MMGFKIIREMTKEEMVEELLAGQRVAMNKADLDTLKGYVIQARLHQTHERLMEEADIERPQGIFGMLGRSDDE